VVDRRWGFQALKTGMSSTLAAEIRKLGASASRSGELEAWGKGGENMIRGKNQGDGGGKSANHPGVKTKLCNTPSMPTAVGADEHPQALS